MSIRDYNKVIIMENGTTGEILDTVKIGQYNYGTLNGMVMDLFYKTVIEDNHTLMLKVGYKN